MRVFTPAALQRVSGASGATVTAAPLKIGFILFLHSAAAETCQFSQSRSPSNNTDFQNKTPQRSVRDMSTWSLDKIIHEHLQACWPMVESIGKMMKTEAHQQEMNWSPVCCCCLYVPSRDSYATLLSRCSRRVWKRSRCELGSRWEMELSHSAAVKCCRRFQLQLFVAPNTGVVPQCFTAVDVTLISHQQWSEVIALVPLLW